MSFIMQEPWLEYVNFDRVGLEITSQVIAWLGHVKPSYHDQSRRSTILVEQNGELILVFVWLTRQMLM